LVVPVVAVLVGSIVAPLPVRAATTLPAGFARVGRPSGQAQYMLTAFAPLPDNGILTAGKDGTVAYVSPDDEVRTIAKIPARNTGDIGLVGLEVAADYSETGRVYTVYAYNGAGGGYHRLSAWTVNNPMSPTSMSAERVILDGITADSDFHGATGVMAEPDGTLWLSVGDSSAVASVDPTALRALDVNDPHGKILRVKQDGTGLPDNPYFDAGNPSSWRSRVYASGFRSPFRFAVDPRTGAVVVGDVGWYSFEEINVVRKGAGYGWPCWEGNVQTPGYRDLAGCRGVGHAAPAVAYPPGVGRSVTGGVFYTGESWPEQYRNSYLYADFVAERQWTLKFDDRGEATSTPNPFGSEIGGPTQFRVGPNGDVMYSDLPSNKVWRIRYQPGNRPPEVQVTTKTDPDNRTVAFDASGTTDLDGDELAFDWDFGDGTPGGTGAKVSHAYPADGTCCYTAKITVTDIAGPAGAVSQEVAVRPTNHEPRLTLAPLDVEHRVGDPVIVEGVGYDQEDGGLSELSWSTDLVHCREAACHSHPGGASKGQDFRTSFPDHGEEVRLKITATAIDSAGAVVAKEFIARPKLRRLSVDTSTPAAVTLNSRGQQSALVTVGSTNSVQVSNGAGDGVATFDRWADGSISRDRTVVMPEEDLTITAIYRTPMDRRLPQLKAVLGAPVEPEQGDENLRWRGFERGRAYWSPALGVHEVHGMIFYRYSGLGGHIGYGLPITDETGTADGVGRFNHFTGGSIYWTPGTGAQEVYGGIREQWRALGSERSPLGYPVTGETGTADGVGRFNYFTGGAIYWTLGTGAHEVYGGIGLRWQQLGLERGLLGYPMTGETGTADGVGRFNHFTGGSIYWTPGTGAQEIYGGIRERWRVLGSERSPLGYPTTGETGTPDGVGRFNHFTGGSIYWTPGTGAQEVYGGIRERWRELGWERSYLGYPMTGETGTPDGVGRFNHFTGGSIYWTPGTGAQEVYGGIRERWREFGWERSYLGYPTSGEYSTQDGRRSDFQGGYITWSPGTGAIARRW
jgi:uncharacterized protein with LGFP repeats/glucose/arabinose dehydrogenase